MSSVVPSRHPLDRRLPESVAQASRPFLIGFFRFPVFSAPWLRRRALVFAIVFGGYVFFTSFWPGMTQMNLRVATRVSLYTYVAWMLLVNLGPGMACLARARRMPERIEKRWVVAAIVAGIAIMYPVEQWFVDLCMREMAPFMQQPKLQGDVKSATAVIRVVSKLVLLGLFGGGLALPAYFAELRRWRDVRDAEAVARLTREKQQAELRLSVLQAQVEPHFLFNTLASVRALVRTDPAQSEAALDALVTYLRASIPRLRGDETAVATTLGQQLDLCASYLEVMRIRTAGRLQYAVEVDEALRGTSFPPMLLITLVENAIKHGIEPKPGPGRVTISAMRDGDALRALVDDDGVGLQPGVGGGLGLANVRAQLDALYGKRATFDLRGRASGGVRAELRIPMEQAA